MFDFVKPAIKYTKNFKAEVYPRFTVKKTQDLMIRGGDFYAIWDYRKEMWSTDEQDAIDIIDSELDEYAKEQAEKNPNMEISVLRIRDADSGYIDVWHKYVKQQNARNLCSARRNSGFCRYDSTKKYVFKQKVILLIKQCAMSCMG